MTKNSRHTAHRNFVVALSLFLLVSCGKVNPSAQQDKLGGYWQIESVELPDGTTKDFSFSATLDYIALSEGKGIRTKVAPKLDGTFKNNGASESFIPKIEDDSLRLYYTTPFDTWKETVLVATDSILKIKNKEGKIYAYKKFVKFTFDN